MWYGIYLFIYYLTDLYCLYTIYINRNYIYDIKMTFTDNSLQLIINIFAENFLDSH